MSRTSLAKLLNITRQTVNPKKRAKEFSAMVNRLTSCFCRSFMGSEEQMEAHQIDSSDKS